MPGQHRVVGDDRVVAQTAVVSDVGVDHQQVVVADDRQVVCLQRPVDGDVLADGVARADDHPAGAVGHVYVLGESAQDGAFEDVVVRAQRGSVLDDDVTFQDAPWTDGHVRFDDAQRTDADVGTDFCFGTNGGQRMNAHGKDLEEGSGGRVPAPPQTVGAEARKVAAPTRTFIGRPSGTHPTRCNDRDGFHGVAIWDPTKGEWLGTDDERRVQPVIRHSRCVTGHLSLPSPWPLTFESRRLPYWRFFPR